MEKNICSYWNRLCLAKFTTAVILLFNIIFDLLAQNVLMNEELDFQNLNSFPFLYFGNLVTTSSTNENSEDFVVFDYSAVRPLSFINFRQNDIFQTGAFGRGPGEYSRGGVKIISFSNRFVIVNDYTLRNFNVYNHQGNFLTTVSGMTKDGAIGTWFAVQDSLILYQQDYNMFDLPTKSLFTLLKLENDRNLMEISTGFESKSFPQFADLYKNNALKIGPIKVRNNIIYKMFLYSDFILAWDYLQKKEKIIRIGKPFPLSPTRKKGEFVVAEPEQFTAHYLDMDIKGKYIIALFSGEEFKYNEIASTVVGKGKVVKDVEAGSIFHLYEIESGELIDKADVEAKVVNFEIVGNKVLAFKAGDEKKIVSLKLVFKKAKFQLE